MKREGKTVRVLGAESGLIGGKIAVRYSFAGGAYQPHMSALRHSLPGVSLSDRSMTTGAFSFEVIPSVAVFSSVAPVSRFSIDRRYQIP